MLLGFAGGLHEPEDHNDITPYKEEKNIGKAYPSRRLADILL
jgi:hypothetical protein